MQTKNTPVICASLAPLNSSFGRPPGLPLLPNNDISYLPSEQKIESLTKNLEGNYNNRSHKEILKAGISQKAMDANKIALVRLVNLEGTTQE